MDGTELVYILPSLSTVILGWIGWIIRNSRKEQKEFQLNETNERLVLEKKIEDEYLEEEKHTLLCENAGLKLAKSITKHFDEKFKEHEDELKKVIKQNGHST